MLPPQQDIVVDALVSGTVALLDTPQLRLRLTAKAKLGDPPAGLLQGLGAAIALPVIDPARKQVRWLSLSGSVSGGIATLTGTVFDASDSDPIEVPVAITADERLGSITLHFGDLILQGLGEVCAFRDGGSLTITERPVISGAETSNPKKGLHFAVERHPSAQAIYRVRRRNPFLERTRFPESAAKSSPEPRDRERLS